MVALMMLVADILIWGCGGILMLFGLVSILACCLGL